MGASLLAQRPPFELGDRGRARLAAHLREAIRRARTRRLDGVLASVTVRLGAPVDPSAVVFTARRPGEPWLCLEQPDRERGALAALGCVAALEA
ncbi:MAG: isochorismate synthase, partial [Solirubrobacterales bacterium]|nr:isochorismate synthase [Solirubrobacterales bacterium]